MTFLIGWVKEKGYIMKYILFMLLGNFVLIVVNFDKMMGIEKTDILYRVRSLFNTRTQQKEQVILLYLAFGCTGNPCSSLSLLLQNCWSRGMIPDDGRARTGKTSVLKKRPHNKNLQARSWVSICRERALHLHCTKIPKGIPKEIIAQFVCDNLQSVLTNNNF